MYLQLMRNHVSQLILAIIGTFDRRGQPAIAPHNDCGGIVTDGALSAQ
jgi:hypothetical protein